MVLSNKQPQVKGPYDFERLRHRPGEYPRQPQPGYQPNQKTQVRGNTTRGYWDGVLKSYLDRRKISQETALALGRLR